MATAISFSPVWPLPLSSATKPNRGGSPLKFCPKLMTSTRPVLSISSLNKLRYPLPPKASVEIAEFVVEPGTSVKFQRKVDVPGCPESLVLIGTGSFVISSSFSDRIHLLPISSFRINKLCCHRNNFSLNLSKAVAGFREKVFAIIGVKVYAAAFYAKSSIDNILDAWKGKSVAAVLEDSSLYKSIYQAPLDKSLAIVLVRDVDGKTFWNALDDVISPRIKQPSAVDESALATFQSTFQGRDLKQGTSIFLTWTQHSHMLVSISLDGPPSKVDAKIESWNVTLALFDAFFGDSPVSPTLKASVAEGLAKVFN